MVARRTRVLLAAAAVALFAGWRLYLRWRPIANLDGVTAVTLRLAYTRETPTAPLEHQFILTVREPARTQPLLAVLRGASGLSVCKCGWLGELMLEHGTLGTEKVGIWSGRDPTGYEVITRGDYYRVDRAHFLAAIAALGLDPARLP